MVHIEDRRRWGYPSPRPSFSQVGAFVVPSDGRCESQHNKARNSRGSEGVGGRREWDRHRERGRQTSSRQSSRSTILSCVLSCVATVSCGHSPSRLLESLGSELSGSRHQGGSHGRRGEYGRGGRGEGARSDERIGSTGRVQHCGTPGTARPPVVFDLLVCSIPAARGVSRHGGLVGA